MRMCQPFLKQETLGKEHLFLKKGEPKSILLIFLGGIK